MNHRYKACELPVGWRIVCLSGVNSHVVVQHAEALTFTPGDIEPPLTAPSAPAPPLTAPSVSAPPLTAPSVSAPPLTTPSVPAPPLTALPVLSDAARRLWFGVSPLTAALAAECTGNTYKHKLLQGGDGDSCGW